MLAFLVWCTQLGTALADDFIDNSTSTPRTATATAMNTAATAFPTSVDSQSDSNYEITNETSSTTAVATLPRQRAGRLPESVWIRSEVPLSSDSPTVVMAANTSVPNMVIGVGRPCPLSTTTHTDCNHPLFLPYRLHREDMSHGK